MVKGSLAEVGRDLPAGKLRNCSGEPTAAAADEWTVKRWSRILLTAGKRWNADNVFKHSAAVSFYMLFSLAPITIIAIGVASLVFGRAFAAQQLAAQLTQLVGQEGADVIRKAMEANAVHTRGWVATAIGLGVMVIGATTVFAQLQDSLNAIWSVTAKPSRSGWVVFRDPTHRQSMSSVPASTADSACRPVRPTG